MAGRGNRLVVREKLSLLITDNYLAGNRSIPLRLRKCYHTDNRVRETVPRQQSGEILLLVLFLSRA